LQNHLLEWLSRAIDSNKPLVFVVISHGNGTDMYPPPQEFLDDFQANVQSLLGSIRIRLGGIFVCGLAGVPAVCETMLDYARQWLISTRQRTPLIQFVHGHFRLWRDGTQECKDKVPPNEEHGRQNLFRSVVSGLFLARVAILVLFILC
jgi:hypothetical protein